MTERRTRYDSLPALTHFRAKAKAGPNNCDSSNHAVGNAAQCKRSSGYSRCMKVDRLRLRIATQPWFLAAKV